MSQLPNVCPALPAPSCPTTPAFGQCHQVSTYDHTAFVSRFAPPNVFKSTPLRSTPCSSFGKGRLDRPGAELSSLKVCGDAVVDCSVQTPLLKGSSSSIPTDLIPFLLLFLAWASGGTLPAAVGPTWVAPSPIPFTIAQISPALLESGGVFVLEQPGLYRLQYNIELQSGTLDASFVSVVMSSVAGVELVVDTRNFTFDPRFSLGAYALSGSVVVASPNANDVFSVRLDNDNTGPIGVSSATLLVELLTTTLV